MKAVYVCGGRKEELPVERAWASFISNGAGAVLLQDGEIQILFEWESAGVKGILKSGDLEIPIVPFFLLQSGGE